MTWRRFFILLGLTLVGLLDATLKSYALHHFRAEQIIASDVSGPSSWFLFGLHRNAGIAFNLPVPLTVVLPITLIVCLALARLVYKRRGSNPKQALAALAAIIGATGNGLDRVMHNFTTDYLILFNSTAINLSDVLILVGICGVLWYDKHLPGHN